MGVWIVTASRLPQKHLARRSLSSNNPHRDSLLSALQYY